MSANNAPSTPIRATATATATAASASPSPGLSPWVVPTPSGTAGSPGSAVITNTPADNPEPVAPTNARNARNARNHLTTSNRRVAPPSSLMAAFNAVAGEGAAGGAAGGEDPVAEKEDGDFGQVLEAVRIKGDGDFGQVLEPVRIKEERDLNQLTSTSRKQGGGSRKLRKSKAKAKKSKKSKSKKSKKNVRRN